MLSSSRKQLSCDTIDPAGIPVSMPVVLLRFLMNDITGIPESEKDKTRQYEWDRSISNKTLDFQKYTLPSGIYRITYLNADELY